MVRDIQDRWSVDIPPIRRFPGIPPEILIDYEDLIRDIIKANKLRPVSQIESVKMIAREIPQEETMSMKLDIGWWWKYGGWPVPHVHYQGEVYRLNPEQWRMFSKTVIKDFAGKLQEVGEIHFEQFAHIADAYNVIV
jgi:hypothetical protein